jgi:hypothetical protein
MRNEVEVNRQGPGLLDVMTRSAVVTGTRAFEHSIGDRRRGVGPRPFAARASDQYGQLCDLMEAGILTRREFGIALDRLTARVSGSPTRRASRRKPTLLTGTQETTK